MSLDDLEKEIYKRETDITEKRKPKEKPPEDLPKVTQTWAEPDVEKKEFNLPVNVGYDFGGAIDKTRKWWKPFIVIAASAFGVAIIVSSFFIFKSLTARGINLEVSLPNQVKLGEVINVSVAINNNSSNELNGAKLSLRLPDGVALVGKPAESRLETRDVGSVGAGIFRKETFQLVALEGKDTVKRLDVALSYDTSGIGASFEKSEERDIAITGPAIPVNLNVPNKVFSGETFAMTLEYKNTVSNDYENVNIRAIYPPTFNFISASTNPSEGTNVWNLGSLSAGQEGKIIINGAMIGQDESFFDVKFETKITLGGQDYAISEHSSNIAISSSPLGISLFINDSKDHIARPGETLKYSVQYKNNTQVGLQDVILTVKLTGDMLDFSNIATEGFVSSQQRTVTWNAANNPDFRVLNPESSGTVELRIPVTSNYPISKINDKNYSVKIEGEIESPTVPNVVGAERTIGVASLSNKIMGTINIESKGFFRDLASGITNGGPIPPTINQQTSYTVHWILKNYGTDVRDVEIQGFLLAGVRWTGQVKSNIETQPQYNPRTQEVLWKIPKVPATRGVISEPIEAIFQIEATPSLHLLNRPMPLVTRTTAKAFDEFVLIEIADEDDALSTQIHLDDPTVTNLDGLVRQ